MYANHIEEKTMNNDNIKIKFPRDKFNRVIHVQNFIYYGMLDLFLGMIKLNKSVHLFLTIRERTPNHSSQIKVNKSSLMNKLLGIQNSDI